MKAETIILSRTKIRKYYNDERQDIDCHESNDRPITTMIIKAFTSIPYSWLIKVLQIYRINQ